MSPDTKKTANLIANEKARKAQEFHTKPLKPKKIRPLPHALPHSTSTQAQPKEKVVQEKKLPTKVKIARGKQLHAQMYAQRKKEANLPNPSLLLSTAALFTLFSAAAAAPTRKTTASTDIPTYNATALASDCATGAIWQSNSDFSVQNTVVGMRSDKPGVPSRIYVSKTSEQYGGNVSEVLSFKSTDGEILQTLTRKPKTEFHDGRPAKTSIVTENPVDVDNMVIGTYQENFPPLDDPSFCNQTGIDIPQKSDTYASTYDAQVTSFAPDEPLTSASKHTIKAPHNIPGKDEIDVTPTKTSLNIILKNPIGKDHSGMIKIISTATKADLCNGEGLVPVNSTLAVYQFDSKSSQEYTMPEGARLVITNAGRVDDFISVNNGHGSQDLVLLGRNSAGQERLFIIQDYDQLQGSVDCDALRLQSTGWQEVLVEGQRDGLLNFFDRRTSTVAGSMVSTPADPLPNLFISTPDNPEAPVWKIDLSAFSGQITLGQNGTMPISVPVYYNSTDAVTIHQSISVTDLDGGPEFLIVGQTYVYDEGTPVGPETLDTLSVFDAATGELRYVIKGGMDTWGMGMNHKATAYGGIVAANINGQAGLITLNLQGLEPGFGASYFIAGEGPEYTLQCINPSPAPAPTPTTKPTSPPTSHPDNDAKWEFRGAMALGAATLIVGVGFLAGCGRSAPKSGSNGEETPINSRNHGIQ